MDIRYPFRVKRRTQSTGVGAPHANRYGDPGLKPHRMIPKFQVLEPQSLFLLHVSGRYHP